VKLKFGLDILKYILVGLWYVVYKLVRIEIKNLEGYRRASGIELDICEQKIWNNLQKKIYELVELTLALLIFKTRKKN
jgi:hypothetical protein